MKTNQNTYDYEDPIVSVVLPAFNEEETIEKAITSIKNQNYDNNLVEIIVVDNNSTDRTRTIAENQSVRVHFLEHGPVGKVRNTGAELAKGRILFFLDADCIAPNDWIRNGVSQIIKNENIVLGGGYELRKEPKALEKLWLLDGPNGALLPKDLLGGSIAISKSTFKKAGGFDETVTSGEDSLLSKSLRKLGCTVKIDRKMSVTNLGNPTSFYSFLKRQIWHSENYLRNFREDLKDPTLILTLFFLFSVALTIILVVLRSELLAFSATASILTPSILSIKRIWRSKNYKHILSFHKIYLVDLVYMIGRTIGLLKGVSSKIRKLK